MPRFVLLRHDMPTTEARSSHWDLMFEREGVLRTWALEQLPAAGGEVEALPLPDHRLHYLTYEGPVSGGRGEVRREDDGEYTLLTLSDKQWLCELEGRHWRGRLELRADSANDQRWLVSFSPSDAATC